MGAPSSARQQAPPLQGIEDVLSFAKERDRRQKGNLRHSVRDARACRSDVSTDPWPRSDSVRACLYVSLPCGKGRDREGT